MFQDSSYGGSDLGSAENISHNPGLAPASSPPGPWPGPAGPVPAIALSGSVETLVPETESATEHTEHGDAVSPAPSLADGEGVESVVVPKSSSTEEGWGKQK